MVINVHRNDKAWGRGRLYAYRNTVTTRMTSALRWAAMRANVKFFRVLLTYIRKEKKRAQSQSYFDPCWVILMFDVSILHRTLTSTTAQNVTDVIFLRQIHTGDPSVYTNKLLSHPMDICRVCKEFDSGEREEQNKTKSVGAGAKPGTLCNKHQMRELFSLEACLN